MCSHPSGQLRNCIGYTPELFWQVSHHGAVGHMLFMEVVLSFIWDVSSRAGKDIGVKLRKTAASQYRLN